MFSPKINEKGKEIRCVTPGALVKKHRKTLNGGGGGDFLTTVNQASFCQSWWSFTLPSIIGFIRTRASFGFLMVKSGCPHQDLVQVQSVVSENISQMTSSPGAAAYFPWPMCPLSRYCSLQERTRHCHAGTLDWIMGSLPSRPGL